ncbi:hypothetical protein TRFO_31928 [Tritrichomonas foetus]|uniref:Uncharacterized protein n=1 Tax=Tritrichomonas foetus TaxID=1144522 RepID=A0A1J4JRC4_9EUKA|nr:hypothetical protein TRFO_31928 [Tritrichomonas foetus]|eukprot:OHT01298.1 hypothetical protein TRFO_31928 [Tritrichomonas foetus]
MNFDPNNPYYAQLFRNRYDTLSAEREKERDSFINTHSSNFLTKHYPPYSAFRAANELTREKIVLEEFDRLNRPINQNDPAPINKIRLSQTADILRSVLKECEEQRDEINAENSQLVDFLKSVENRKA